MRIQEAKQYLGKNCRISWIDRQGREHNETLQIRDLQLVPLYGAYFVGEAEEVRLDAVRQIRALE